MFAVSQCFLIMRTEGTVAKEKGTGLMDHFSWEFKRSRGRTEEHIPLGVEDNHKVFFC